MRRRCCVPVRHDATQQLRLPIAAAACQCDEDWHSGKLSLKIPLFHFPINQTIRAARTNAPGAKRGPRASSGGVLEQEVGAAALCLLGRIKQIYIQVEEGGKKNVGFWGAEEDRASKGREVQTRPRTCSRNVSAEGRKDRQLSLRND